MNLIHLNVYQYSPGTCFSSLQIQTFYSLSHSLWNNKFLYNRWIGFRSSLMMIECQLHITFKSGSKITISVSTLVRITAKTYKKEFLFRCAEICCIAENTSLKWCIEDSNSFSRVSVGEIKDKNYCKSPIVFKPANLLR